MTAVSQAASRANGWYGMLVLVATEAALFGTLIGTYVYLRFQTATWPPRGDAPPSVAAPLVLSLVLLSTAATMAYASRAAAGGRRGAAIWAVALTLVVQAGYLATQAHLYVDDLATLSPRTDAYASIYFTMLAVHHAHVGIGIVLDGWILARLARGLTRYRQAALGAIALYWYFVAIAGLLVTATTLSPSW
jgi:heme/copper-type cytochrome/quinol oxidase subunit 3